jgi:hypothetical protein
MTRSLVRDLLIVCILVATFISAVAHAQAPSTLGRRTNTWAARSSTGQTLAGTWTASEDAKTGAVTGGWTLTDAQGRTVASGGWSAAKSPTGWSGSWRAVAVGQTGEYSGTWTANVDLKPEAKMSELFAKAFEAAVTGTWKTGTQFGAWTIQAFK